MKIILIAKSIFVRLERFSIIFLFYTWKTETERWTQSCQGVVARFLSLSYPLHQIGLFPSKVGACFIVIQIQIQLDQILITK